MLGWTSTGVNPVLRAISMVDLCLFGPELMAGAVGVRLSRKRDIQAFASREGVLSKLFSKVLKLSALGVVN